MTSQKRQVIMRIMETRNPPDRKNFHVCSGESCTQLPDTEFSQWFSNSLSNKVICWNHVWIYSFFLWSAAISLSCRFQTQPICEFLKLSNAKTNFTFDRLFRVWPKRKPAPPKLRSLLPSCKEALFYLPLLGMMVVVVCWSAFTPVVWELEFQSDGRSSF